MHDESMLFHEFMNIEKVYFYKKNEKTFRKNKFFMNLLILRKYALDESMLFDELMNIEKVHFYRKNEKIFRKNTFFMNLLILRKYAFTANCR